MQGVLGWIGDIIAYIGSFLPHYFVVSQFEEVVLLPYGKPKLVKMGFHWYIPAWTPLLRMLIVAQTQDFKTGISMTNDLKPVAADFSMMFKVTDVTKAVMTCDNIVQTIGELGQSVISPVVAAHTLQELKDMLVSGGLTKRLTKDANKLLKEWGVDVISCRVNNLAPARVIYLVNAQ